MSEVVLPNIMISQQADLFGVKVNFISLHLFPIRPGVNLI